MAECFSPGRKIFFLGFSLCLSLSAFAFREPYAEVSGVAVALAGFAGSSRPPEPLQVVSVDVTAPVDVTVLLSNRTDSVRSGRLTLAVNDDWRLESPAVRSVHLPAGGVLEERFRVSATARVLPAAVRVTPASFAASYTFFAQPSMTLRLMK